MRRITIVAFVALIAARAALAAEQHATDERDWSFSASAAAYLIPGPDDYVQPTLTADHHWMHLEARHNYEAVGATSLWFGYNFSVGETVTFEGTAMAGGVFGEVDGIAPAYTATLSWTNLAFYSEGEYVFDSNESFDSYFYAWSELSWDIADYCRVGLVGQRTRAYQSDRDIQRGVLLGFSSETVGFTAYAFNIDERSPTFVLSLGVSF